MKLSPKSGIALVFGIVIASALAGKALHAWAEESPPAIVLDAVEDIQSNQERIEELRPLVEEFNALKTDNAIQVGRMQGHCYDFNWSTKKPFKMENCPLP